MPHEGRLAPTSPCGTLTITAVSGSFNLRGNSTCKVDITVPSGIELDLVSLEVDAGDVEYLGSSQGTKFTQPGPGATLTATVDAGEIEVKA